jgi:hypothetical protein
MLSRLRLPTLVLGVIVALLTPLTASAFAPKPHR